MKILVGITHDVDENKGTYSCYPTIYMKINKLFNKRAIGLPVRVKG